MLTCLACRIGFESGDAQRAHYKTEWHRYNLKRKTADLDPVAFDNFQERMKMQLQSTAEAAVAEAFTGVCRPCGKRFNSENAYSNHLNSKKHKEREAKQAANDKKKASSASANASVSSAASAAAASVAAAATTAAAVTDPVAGAAGSGVVAPADEKAVVAGDAEGEAAAMDLEDEYLAKEESIALEECLFCSRVSKTLADNVDHMAMKHGLFIPDIEYLQDLPGLIAYLGEKVALGKLCLYCNSKGKAFRSKEAAQGHMVDKGHCKIFYEGDAALEFGDFYDFSSTYPDYDEAATTTAGAAEGAGDGEGASNEKAAEGGEHEARLPDNTLRIRGDTQELVLPNGNRVGHRSLARYYRQNIKPSDSRELVAVRSKLLNHYRASGLAATPAQLAARKDQHAKWKSQQKERMQVGVKANKLQHHFRLQVLF